MRHGAHNARWRKRAAVSTLGAAIAAAWPAALPHASRAADVVSVSATQPADASPTPGDSDRGSGDGTPRGRGMRGSGLGGFGGFGRHPFGPPQADIDPAEVSQFMADHAPKFWAWVQQSEENRRRMLEATAQAAYASYQRIRQDDPDLYKVIVDRVDIEDKLFGLRARLRSMPREARQSLSDEVKSQLTAWVDLGLKERKLRLDRLKRTVSKEEQQLADEQSRRDKTIEDRLDGMINGGSGGNWPGGPGRRGDGGRGGRDGGRVAEPSQGDGPR